MNAFRIESACFCANCDMVFDAKDRRDDSTCPVCGSISVWPISTWVMPRAVLNKLQPWRGHDQQREESAHPCGEVSARIE